MNTCNQLARRKNEGSLISLYLISGSMTAPRFHSLPEMRIELERRDPYASQHLFIPVCCYSYGAYVPLWSSTRI